MGRVLQNTFFQKLKRNHLTNHQSENVRVALFDSLLEIDR